MAAAAFLILEFVVSNRRIPHAVVAALLAALPPPSPRDSQRLRKALALRALDAALHDENAASTAPLLRKARAVLADPDMAACFPQPLPFSLPDDKDDDEVTAAAALADLKHILDHEWASLPPSTLELAADRIAGAGALDMWAKADGSKRRKLRLLVGDSIERETLAKLEQDAYASHPSVVLDVDKSANALDRIDANETDHAQGDGEADLSNKNNEAECSQEAHARPQQESVKGAVKGKVLDTPQVMDNTTSHVTEQSARTNAESHHVVAPNRNLMVRDPSASTYEWDGLGHSDDERPLRHRQLLPFERKPIPSTVSQKTKKKWSKTQEKTLLEGIEKYGKGNWKDIKMAYPDVFEDRSTVDLKDKFRNMERHQSV
ncbi:hypothetical protein QOZ80_9AG0676590 [Eleusine coracana subsp. coracana]|nr:hypothetical protein QOZ80_9AG0676590 [Eleusine coracana subsp. coracana]